MTAAVAPGGVREVLRLAWPAILSFLLQNAYRINDQLWVRPLGTEALAAIASCTFVLILNAGVIYLAAGGALPLVAQATGAGDPRERDGCARSALFLGLCIAAVMTVLGVALAPVLPRALGLDGETRALSAAYLGTIYAGALPLVLAPIVDAVFIGMGNTRVPLLLQCGAVLANLVLNPLLIFGLGPLPALGIAGAALATCLSRALPVVAGLLILRREFGVQVFAREGVTPARVARVARLGAPIALSIVLYAGVYWALLALVLARLGPAVLAALGIGFNAFESVSFPVLFGIAIAGASLVGRRVGAGDLAAARRAVRDVRRVARLAGAGFAVLFWTVGPRLVPLLAGEADVIREATGYVLVLGWSQLFVAEEAVSEKALQGAGRTRPILWISGTGNLLRIPLAWLFAVPLGCSATGVWWAINLTTFLKAGLLHRAVERCPELGRGR